MSVELRGRRGVVGDLPVLQAHAITVAAVMLLFVVGTLAVATGVAFLGLAVRMTT